LATTVLLTAAKDGIVKGLTYRVRYRAINDVGEGPWSDVAYVRAATLPMAPPSPIAATFDATGIDLVLSRTSDDGGSAGGGAFTYNLFSDEGVDGSPFHLLTYDGSSLTFGIAADDPIGASGSSFTVGQIYTFKYTAENEVGDSELRYGAPTMRVALGGTPATPGQPTVDILASNETAINLDWPRPAATDALEVGRYILWSDLGVPGNSHAVSDTTLLN
jgi:hypothetical protein